MRINQEPVMVVVLRKLDEHKGRLPEVARVSGVPYQTVTKIACRLVRDPRISTVQALLNYFASRTDTNAATGDTPSAN
ncbi:hypothetical protein PAP18089_01899 [Pandoraea apista]|uniref:Uncharacterized protein n=1 Tax=Pandoraea apista TaxID=93218 RepID=A0A5E5P3B8_9BURK|nr:hypothetical protein [Pandoraea apista]VVG70927.1 hypothetical protein PAP18089_01899 [Pandoraea apista]